MKWTYRTLYALLLLSIFFLGAKSATAQSVCGSKPRAECIRELEQQRDQAKDKKNTLSSQIELMNTQIYLNELQVQTTEEQIKTAQVEIENLSGRIGGFDRSLDFLTKVLLQKIVEGYKRKQEVNFLQLILEADNASTLVNRLKYVQVTQSEDSKLTFQVQEAKQNAEKQKDQREKKKEELGKLEIELVGRKSELNSQKKEKQDLLTITQNDEARYQRLIQQALAESKAVQNALVSGQSLGPVKKGDPIALVGNSGYPYCSDGAHLHFEVHTGDAWNSWTDPSPYLSQWGQPLDNPVIISQGYGQTPWSSRYTYSGGIHTGIDMYSTSSNVIHAPADGTLYSSSEACGPAVINVRYIDHGGGIKSFYLHVQ